MKCLNNKFCWTKAWTFYDNYDAKIKFIIQYCEKSYWFLIKVRQGTSWAVYTYPKKDPNVYMDDLDISSGTICVAYDKANLNMCFSNISCLADIC